MRHRTIEITIPKGFMNCGVTLSNQFIADSNDSQNWNNLRFPLPSGKWVILNKVGQVVILRKKHWL